MYVQRELPSNTLVNPPTETSFSFSCDVENDHRFADKRTKKKGNTTTGSSRGDEGYGVQPTEYRKGSEADLTSALQSSDARGGMMGAGDESYGVRENLFEPPGVLIEPKRADWDLESSLPAAASAAAWALVLEVMAMGCNFHPLGVFQRG